MRLIHLLLLVLVPIVCFAEVIQPDVSTVSYKAPITEEADLVYDFGGSYTDLQEVSIVRDGERRVQLNLPAVYPVLQTVVSSTVSGKNKILLTGKYKELNAARFTSDSGIIDLNLFGMFESDLNVHVHSNSGKVFVRVPKDVNLIVETYSPKGKVRNFGNLKEKGFSFFGLLKSREFMTRIDRDKKNQMPLVRIYVETVSGDILIY